jgi:NitT/TauT family transport system substrate-binding protein
MMKKAALIFTLITCILAACGSPSSRQAVSGTQSIETIRLPMGFRENIQFAPLYVAEEKGYFEEVGLNIDFDYSAENDNLALVGAGERQFAIVSGEQVLLARKQGLPVVYVLAWWQDYPVAVTALASNQINSPEDLKGKRIGLPGLFGASYIGLRALLAAGNLKEEDVILDSIGYNQVEALAAGQEDAVVVYANNEPIQLAAMGYPVDTLRVADYVQLASNGLITNEKTIAENPDLVRRMVQAIRKGIADTIADPEEAYRISEEYVDGLSDLDKDIQMDILKASIELWRTEVIGQSQLEAWENMHQVLVEMGSIPASLDVNQAFTNQFINP